MRRLMAWFRLLRMNKRWMENVRKNRARHSDLIKKEKGWMDRVIAAQRMMMRDRDIARDAFERGEIRYPDQWDYMIPATLTEWRAARGRRAARERDVMGLREQLQFAD